MIWDVELALGSWLRLFVVMFMSTMKEEAVRPEPPVLLAVDEFPGVGKLEEIQNLGPGMRSYGVRFWGVIQDLGQLEAAYGRFVARTLVGSAQAVQVKGLTEIDTVQRLSYLLGGHEVMVPTGGPRPARMGRPLLDAKQVMELLDPEKKSQIV